MSVTASRAGQEHDRSIVIGSPQAPGDFETIDARQHYIQHNRVEADRLSQSQTLHARVGDRNDPARFLHHALEQLGHLFFSASMISTRIRVMAQSMVDALKTKARASTFAVPMSSVSPRISIVRDGSERICCDFDHPTPIGH